jgi:rhamnose transport system ATP-binding protein
MTASSPEAGLREADRGDIRLCATDVTKRYAAVTALDGANLTVRRGEVHALLGANGAGKSTLVKVITGVITPDSGTIELDGDQVSFRTARAARDAGVATVFQDPPLFPQLDVAENITAGMAPRTRIGTIDRLGARRETQKILDRLGISLPPGRLVQTLSAAEREFVAIARALRVESKVLILDEPTASLTPDDTGRLFEVVRRYRDDGGAVLFISHRMEEIREIADRITIFRDGTDVFSGPASSLTDEQIIERMLNQDRTRIATELPDDGAGRPGDVALSVQGLNAGPRVRDVSFDLRGGEIVVIAGLVGSGRSETLETIVGLRPETSGRVRVRGHALRRRSPRAMSRRGVVLVPEDRDVQGLVYGFGISENIGMGGANRTSRYGLLRRGRERKAASEQMAALSVRAAGTEADVASLSGGNRQKVVLGKWLATTPSVMLLDEPTKGVDVGAKAEIHAILRRLARDEGMAVLVVSSDLEEVLGLADRVLVMREGHMVAELSGAQATERAVMTAASIAQVPESRNGAESSAGLQNTTEGTAGQ